MLLLCILVLGGVGNLWAQSDKSAIYTSNVTLSTVDGTSASTAKVKLSSSGTEYSAIKAGTSSKAGAIKITAPSGTKYLHLHIAGWNGESVTVSVTPESNVDNKSISLTSDTGISGSSTTYTLSTSTNATTNYYKVIAFANALTSNTDLMFTATNGKRFVIWGVNSEEMATGEATTVTIDTSGITNTDVAAGTAAGSLSAIVKNASSNAIAAAAVTWTSSKPSVATINSTTGEVTLVKKGSTTITANYAGVEGTYQPSNNTYVLNVTNSTADDGTFAHPFTVLEARDALDASEIDSETDYYVKGYIAKIGTFNNESGQLIYWISADGSMTNNVQCYKGKNIGGAAFAAATDLEVGDIATVKGKLTIYGGTTYEFTENNEVVSITPRTKVNIASFTATTNPLILGVTETTATTVTNDLPGWTPAIYAYVSDNESVATVNASGVITAVARGTAKITVTPVVSATDPTYKVGESKSIEITVSNPSHTVTFSVNGITSDESVEEGEAITFPVEPAAMAAKSFVGWVNTPIVGKTDETPAFVTSATMGDTDVTYYAVFASSSETTGWRKLSASEISEAGTYALLTTDGHAFNGTISSGHGQVTTNAFEFVNNVATSAPTGTCEITLQLVTGGFKMYNEGKGYLYASAASSGKLAWHESESSYWSYASPNWKYNSNSAYLRSYNNSSIRTYGANNGEVLVFAQKTNVASYSAYCTTVSSVPVSLNVSGYATFSCINALDFSDDSEFSAWQITGVNGTAITFSQITGTVAANTGVLLKGTASATVNIPVAASGATLATNKLVGITTATDVAADTYYGLSDNKFVKVNAGTVPAGKALLPVSAVGAGVKEFTFIFDDKETGIRTIEKVSAEEAAQIFDLSGRRLSKMQKGINIVNGKKILF